MSDERVICLGFPPFHEERFVARLEALDGIRPLVLPIDPDADWISVNASHALPEPPPFA